MRAWLTMQEGPGAGPSYPLDPSQNAMLSVGRSSECTIPIRDNRASRHHSDIRWSGQQWEVVDRGSTNGTYVNGMQIHGAHGLRVGDRITIGETTMVMREFEAQGALRQAQDGALRQAQGAPAGAYAGPQASAPAAQSSTGTTVLFWVVQGLIAVAVVCLATGAFLPWLRVTGSLSQDMQPMLQNLANILDILSGQDSILHVSQEIGGMEGYGKLTLGLAIVTMIMLVVDVFFYRRSPAAAIVYLVSGVVAIGAMGFDLINFYRTYEQVKDLSILFGVQLADVVQVFDQFIEFEITTLIGLPLTGAGLVLLLAGGIGRLVVTLLERGKPE